MNYVKINQQILPEDQAFISVKERACRFGDGIFITCKIVSGIIYNFESHLDSLESGLKAIKINFNISDLKNSSQKLIAKNNLIDGWVRISISRGIGSEGYFPIKNIKPLLIIETSENAQSALFPTHLFISSITKISLKSLPINFKLSQGLNSTLAAIEARENNCFDSLMLNDEGKICETSCANIFWIKNNILYTPHESCGLVAGTIREKIIELSPIEVKKVIADQKELFLAEEIFITNCKLGVLNIEKIIPQNHNFPQKKYSKIFADLLNEDILNYVKKEKSRLA